MCIIDCSSAKPPPDHDVASSPQRTARLPTASRLHNYPHDSPLLHPDCVAVRPTLTSTSLGRVPQSARCLRTRLHLRIIAICAPSPPAPEPSVGAVLGGISDCDRDGNARVSQALLRATRYCTSGYYWSYHPLPQLPLLTGPIVTPGPRRQTHRSAARRPPPRRIVLAAPL